MKYNEFRNLVKNYPLVKSTVFPLLGKNAQLLRRQVSTWLKKKQMYQLKRGVYSLNEQDKSAACSAFFVSGQLCQPSYISLESALSFYNMIPERVTGVTAITSKKTQQYQNVYGNFYYHHLNVNKFDYFIDKKDEFGWSYYLALPEKALIDYFYFQCRQLQQLSMTLFEENFRLQNLEIINIDRLITISKLFNKKKLDKLLDLFLLFLEQKDD